MSLRKHMAAPVSYSRSPCCDMYGGLTSRENTPHCRSDAFAPRYNLMGGRSSALFKRSTEWHITERDWLFAMRNMMNGRAVSKKRERSHGHLPARGACLCTRRSDCERSTYDHIPCTV